MLKGLRGESNGDRDDNMCEWIDVHDIEIMKSSDAHSNSHYCAQSVNTYN